MTTVHPELKRGSTEMLILVLLGESERHGYEILKLLDERSEGLLRFHIGSVYPILFRLERRGWIRGRWDGQRGGRRRRIYRLTRDGARALRDEKSGWVRFVAAVNRIAGIQHA